MARHCDTQSTGRSKIVPFVEGEDAEERHERRQTAAQDKSAWMMNALQPFGVTLDIKNYGEHWLFRKGMRVCEWRPRTAKFVPRRNYENGVHCHDVEQALELVRKWI